MDWYDDLGSLDFSLDALGVSSGSNPDIESVDMSSDEEWPSEDTCERRPSSAPLPASVSTQVSAVGSAPRGVVRLTPGSFVFKGAALFHKKIGETSWTCRTPAGLGALSDIAVVRRLSDPPQN